MYLDQILLKNVRGFEDLKFELQREDGSYAGWTVFTGDNGSGKSTLLKAIAVALNGPDKARALQPSFRGWLRAGEPRGLLGVRVKPTLGDDFFKRKGRTREACFRADIEFTEGFLEPMLEFGSHENARSSIWSGEASGWFSCGYGPFRRVFGASPEATRQMVSPTSERYVTMFNEAASLFEVDQWMKNLAHKALEGRPSEKQQLQVLKQLLSDDLMPNQIGVAEVNSDGLWLNDRTGLHLTWGEMSDGYRSMLALLADILRHMINDYGIDELTSTSDLGHIFVKRSGVVLIDEIDAHLHPEWQRTIGFWLTRHFPNVQFLVTTHSPLVCQAASPQGLFHLPEPGSSAAPRQLSNEEHQKVIASKPDTILLTSAFGLENTRSDVAVAKRRRHAELKAKQRSGAPLTAVEKKELQSTLGWIPAEEQ